MSLAEDRANMTYRKVGNVYLPEYQEDEEELVTPDTVGRYGMMRAEFLYDERPGIYSVMGMRSTLLPHLKEINQTAEEMRDRIIRKKKEEQGLTEQMKNEDPLGWAAAMRQIHLETESMILRELIEV